MGGMSKADSKTFPNLIRYEPAGQTADFYKKNVSNGLANFVHGPIFQIRIVV
jgi:hypothetical protein